MNLIKSIKSLLLVTIILYFTISPNLFSQEKKISENEVPEAVLNSFHKSYQKAEIKGTSIEKEHGKTFYEIESVDGSQKRDLLYTKNGTVAEVEESLTPQDLPAFVRSSVMKKYPKSKIKKAEKVSSGSKTSYELIVLSGEKKREVVLDSSGNIKIVEAKKKENENEKRGEQDEDNDGD